VLSEALLNLNEPVDCVLLGVVLAVRGDLSLPWDGSPSQALIVFSGGDC
jgi:hypothetical protein